METQATNASGNRGIAEGRPGIRTYGHREGREATETVVSMGNVLLEVRRLVLAANGGRGHRELSFSLRKGEVAWISGVFSANCSDLQRVFCGLVAPSKGEIRWKGISISAVPQLLQAELAMLDRRCGLNSALTPREQLAFYHSWRGSCPAMTASAALTRLGLREGMDIPCWRLSDSQRRRVGLARLISARATFWVLEEPTAGLEHHEMRIVDSILGEHLGSRGVAIVLGAKRPYPTHGRVRTLSPGECTHA